MSQLNAQSSEKKQLNLSPLVKTLSSDCLKKYLKLHQNNKTISLNISETEHVEISIEAVVVDQPLFHVQGMSSQNEINFYIEASDLQDQSDILGLKQLPQQLEGQVFLVNRLIWSLFYGYHIMDVRSMVEENVSDVLLRLSVKHLNIQLYFALDSLQRFMGLLEQSIRDIKPLNPSVNLMSKAQTEVSPCIAKILVGLEAFQGLSTGDRILIEPYKNYTEVVFDGKRFSALGGEITQSKISVEDQEIYVFGEKFSVSYQRLWTMFGNVPMPMDTGCAFLFHPKFQSKLPVKIVQMFNHYYVELLENSPQLKPFE